MTLDDPRPAFAKSSAAPPSVGAGAGVEGPFDEEPQLAPGSFLGALPQFFVFPAILVATLTVVYLVLRALAGSDSHDAAELLAQLRSAGPHERWQVLHSLSDGLRRGSMDLSAVPSAELASLYGTLTDGAAGGPQDALMEQLLLFVLAHKRDPELTHFALEALAEGDAGLRRGALSALATARDPAALDALEPVLAGNDADERLLALGALGSIPGQRAADLMAAQFLHTDGIVARNAAMLRGQAGDPRALPFVLRLLERDSYAADSALDGSLAGMSEESRAASRADAVDAFLVEAAKAAGRLGDPALNTPLQKLREADPSLKVRSAAINALHDIETRATAGPPVEGTSETHK